MGETPAIVGLTGGIATGKSTVSAMLAELGVPIVDADVVAREIVAPKSDGLRAIVERFGSSILSDDGALNREALGRVVFGDEAARRDLNAITHPRIALRMMARANELGDQGFQWIVYDAALIVENNLHHALAGLIVVSCTPETQLHRLRARDGFAEQEALDRIASQMPLAAKRAAADWVVENDSGLEDLRAEVKALFQQLTEQFGPVKVE